MRYRALSQLLVATLVALLWLPFGPTLAAAQETLEIYLVDVEGGGATLFVSPESETLLIDTGNGGEAAARDAGRIRAAMRDAGVTEIDHLITTHWHGDHYGAMVELASQVPIHDYIDHGGYVESNQGVIDFLEGAYRELYEAAEHTIVEPGDWLRLGGVDITIMASAKEVLNRPVLGGGQRNPYCGDFIRQSEDNGENAQSVGIHGRYGDFTFLHLGDLTQNTEFELMCPNNPVGTVDVFVVTHHGQPTSNPEVVVHAIEPRVALMNNGTRKGGQPAAMDILHSAPRLEDLWQLHFSQLSGQEYTVPGVFIANGFDDELEAMPVAPLAGGRDASPRPIHNGDANWLKVSAGIDGYFTVTNTRNGFTKAYR